MVNHYIWGGDQFVAQIKYVTWESLREQFADQEGKWSIKEGEAGYEKKEFMRKVFYRLLVRLPRPGKEEEYEEEELKYLLDYPDFGKIAFTGKGEQEFAIDNIKSWNYDQASKHFHNAFQFLGRVATITGQGKDMDSDRLFVSSELADVTSDPVQTILLDSVHLTVPSFFLTATTAIVDIPGLGDVDEQVYVRVHDAVTKASSLLLYTADGLKATKELVDEFPRLGLLSKLDKGNFKSLDIVRVFEKKQRLKVPRETGGGGAASSAAVDAADSGYLSIGGVSKLEQGACKKGRTQLQKELVTRRPKPVPGITNTTEASAWIRRFWGENAQKLVTCVYPVNHIAVQTADSRVPAQCTLSPHYNAILKCTGMGKLISKIWTALGVPRDQDILKINDKGLKVVKAALDAAEARGELAFKSLTVSPDAIRIASEAVRQLQPKGGISKVFARTYYGSTRPGDSFDRSERAKKNVTDALERTTITHQDDLKRGVDELTDVLIDLIGLSQATCKVYEGLSPELAKRVKDQFRQIGEFHVGGNIRKVLTDADPNAFTTSVFKPAVERLDMRFLHTIMAELANSAIKGVQSSIDEVVELVFEKASAEDAARTATPSSPPTKRRRSGAGGGGGAATGGSSSNSSSGGGAATSGSSDDDAQKDLKKHLDQDLIFDVQQVKDLHEKVGRRFAPSGIVSKSGGVQADTSLVTPFIVKVTSRLLRGSAFFQRLKAQRNPAKSKFSAQENSALYECFGIFGNAERAGKVRAVVEEIVDDCLKRCKADLLEKLTGKWHVNKLVKEMLKKLSDQEKTGHQTHQADVNTARLKHLCGALDEHVQNLSHLEMAEDDSFQQFFDLLQENQGQPRFCFSFFFLS
jgi:uncharacterized membrane protein YgcG